MSFPVLLKSIALDIGPWYATVVLIFNSTKGMGVYMALKACSECGHKVSSDASACPSCGKPNKSVVNKEKDAKQCCGCLFIILALVLCLFSPLAGLALFVVGVVLLGLNTRFM